MGPQRGQAFGRSGKRGIDGDEVVESLLDLTKRSQDRSLVLEEEGIAFLGQRGQATHVGLDDLFASQVLFFPTDEARLLDLARLELESLASPLGLAPVAAQGIERGDGLFPGSVGAPYEPEVALQARIGVEPREVGGGIQESLRLVLPVNECEAGRQVAKHVQGNHGAVDRRPALASALDLSTNDDLGAFDGKPQGAEDGLCRGKVAESLHHCTVFAGSDDLGRGTGAENQAEGIHENRLAGPGLARENRKPPVQLQGGIGHDRNVADFE